MKHIKERGYVVTGTMFTEKEQDGLYSINRLAKIKNGWINKILFRTDTVLYFRYNHKECKVTIIVSNNEVLRRIKPIAENVFNVDCLEVEIIKNYCEVIK